ncbi:hypothetical protein BKA69DRAFT_1072860 [Paraphysoderma sedebokerense]|nr:hypothetical protein BKA69DRAFT_1072860 [Paraphysoderma sedebokerense]
MSHYHHNLVNVKSVNTIQISAEASVAFDRLPHLNPSTSTESTEARRSPLDADTLSLLIFNIDKLSDLCSLCSATMSHKQMCDSMFARAQYPLDLVFASSSGYISPQSLQRADPTHSRLTTTSTCRLAHIDNLIQKLEFRYNSLFAAQGSPINRPPYDIIKSHIQTKLKSRIHTFEPSKPSNSPASSSFIPQSSAVGLYTVWDHPNIYYHFLAHLIRRYNSVINTIALHYRESSVKRERVDPINERHVLRRECENYLEDRSTYLLNLPRSAAS